MDIRTQTTLLACIVATALGLSMVLRTSRARVLTAYSVFAFTAGAFYLADFLRSVFVTGGLTGWPVRIALGLRLLSGAVVPSAALAFFLEFLGGQSQARRTSRRVAIFSLFLGLAVAMTPAGHVASGDGRWWRPGPSGRCCSRCRCSSAGCGGATRRRSGPG